MSIVPSANEVIGQVCSMPSDFIVKSNNQQMTAAEFLEWYPLQERIEEIAVYDSNSNRIERVINKV
jgi:hypothetical protein